MSMQNFQHNITKNFSNNLKKLGEFFEDLNKQIPSENVRQVLSHALDWLRPYFAAFGFRISRLNQELIEIVIPLEEQNRDQQGRPLEGVVVFAACEAYKILWKKQFEKDQLRIQIEKVEMQTANDPKTELRIRYEISGLQREVVISEIDNLKKCKQEALLLGYDENDQLCVEIKIEAALTYNALLDWK